MKSTTRQHKISFIHAVDGVLWALKTQPNFRIHILLSLLAIGSGLFLRVTFWKLTLLVFMIILGLVVEMVNTAIEAVVDLVTDEWHKKAKIAKDVSAGAMLMTAIGALLVAFLVLGPEITNYLGFTF